MIDTSKLDVLLVGWPARVELYLREQLICATLGAEKQMEATDVGHLILREDATRRERERERVVHC